MPKKLILKSDLSLGDIVVMTAAVRDLHHHFPSEYITDVRTHFPAVWENNPLITRIDNNDEEAGEIGCDYPLINFSNQRPYHFIHGYIDDLANKLGVSLKPTKFSGDIYLSPEERSWISQVHEITGFDCPFWVVGAGGKFDYTIKWWSQERFQEVVDHFQGRILFVQVGEAQHHHPPLQRVLDLRGRTDTRQLIRLIYHSQGVLCPVTSLMHLAAAVETKSGGGALRPCVVVAGGREPPHWEEYPGHRFLHTIGTLSCCSNGGCWRSRTLPIGDGDPKDLEENRCVHVVSNLPRCMSMITPELVIQAIEGYLAGNNWQPLAEWEANQISSLVGWNPRHVRFTQPKTDPLENRGHWHSGSVSPINESNSVSRIWAAVREIPEYPDTYRGRGIVVCGGGLRYLPSAWVCLHALRNQGCTLAAELWHLPNEVPEVIAQSLLEIGVTCREAALENTTSKHGVCSGWELKSYAILNSHFEDVLYLDADNMAVADPTDLFNTEEYCQTGAVFWPDYGRLACDDPAWKVSGTQYQDEPEFESGQILVNKRTCWKALMLAHWYNTNSAFFYRYFLGDKETFHMAFRFLSQRYSMPAKGIWNLGDAVMCQHDFQGRRIFQHRNRAKWKLLSDNKRIPGFVGEDECLKSLRELRKLWDGRLVGQIRWHHESANALESGVAARLIEKKWHVHLRGCPVARVAFNSTGVILTKVADNWLFWQVQVEAGQISLTISDDEQVLGRLILSSNNEWEGTISLGGQQLPTTIFSQLADQIDQSSEISELTSSVWAYRISGASQRTMTFGDHHEVLAGSGELEMKWEMEKSESGMVLYMLDLKRRNVRLQKSGKGIWRGSFTDNKFICVELLKIPLLELPAKDPPMPPISSRPASLGDYDSQWYQRICRKMKEKPVFHRKQWEIAAIVEATRTIVKKGKLRIIVIAPDSDPMVDLLSSFGFDVMCVELANCSINLSSTAADWCASQMGQLNARTITQPDAFRKRVSVRMLRNALNENVIDAEPFLLICSGLLHQYSKVLAENAAAFTRLLTSPKLKAAIFTGDVELTTVKAGVRRVRDRNLTRLVKELRHHSLKANLSTQCGCSPVESHADSPPYGSDHHITVRVFDKILTSYILVAQKSL